MSQRIRGQEITARFSVDGQVQRGSFFKMTELTITPRQENPEHPFIGELEDDLDFQHHGYDFEFTIHQQDALALRLLESIVQREQSQEVHPDITLTVIYSYRDDGIQNQVHVLYNCFIKMNAINMGGRKEYVMTPFSGKCKRMELMAAS